MMNIILWIVQIGLAFYFLAVGSLKAFTPIAELGAQMAWVNDVAPLFVRLPGYAEILGGLGLILPSLTRIQPRLTPLAAAGLVLIMLLAFGLHLTRGEFGGMATTLIVGIVAAFIVYGRTKVAPIAPR